MARFGKGIGLRGVEDADIEYMARFGKGRVERSRG